MTEEYKSSILKYVTNSLIPGVKQPNTFRDNEVTQTDIQSALAEKGITTSFYKLLNTTTTSNYLIYGNYLDSQDNEYKSFIAVMSQDSEILAILTKYETGTDIQTIYYLDYDENGNIYGIDQPIGSTRYRVILLNNIALETPRGYFCKLRASYYIDSNYLILDLDTSVPHLIRKIPGEATYFIFGAYKVSQTGYNTCLIKFINNVGMANEWEVYQGHYLGEYPIQSYDFIVEKSGDDYKANVYYTYDDKKYLRNEYFDGTQLTGYTEYLQAQAIMCIRVLNDKTAYFSTRTNNQDNTYTVSLYRFQDEATIRLWLKTIEFSIPSFNLHIQDGVLYGIARGFSSDGNVMTWKYVCIAYYKDEIVASDIYSYQENNYLNFNLIVQSSFALHKFIYLCETAIEHPSIVIYDNLYSGGAYIDYGSASAQKGEVYSNGYIVFARPLYNKQIFNNQTTSTLEIPNGYLNDIVLDDKNILSQTNGVLIQDATEIQKNIYETLFLNFTNSISVIDEDTDTTYPSVANYINANTNVGTEENYNDTTMGKIRIRYTSHVVTTPIVWSHVTDTQYIMRTVIDATTEVPYLIEFISNDESTTYLSKELPLTLGNYYKITQKIRIE